MEMLGTWGLRTWIPHMNSTCTLHDYSKCTIHIRALWKCKSGVHINGPHLQIKTLKLNRITNQFNNATTHNLLLMGDDIQ